MILPVLLTNMAAYAGPPSCSLAPKAGAFTWPAAAEDLLVATCCRSAEGDVLSCPEEILSMSSLPVRGPQQQGAVQFTGDMQAPAAWASPRHLHNVSSDPRKCSPQVQQAGSAQQVASAAQDADETLRMTQWSTAVGRAALCWSHADGCGLGQPMRPAQRAERTPPAQAASAASTTPCSHPAPPQPGS